MTSLSQAQSCNAAATQDSYTSCAITPIFFYKDAISTPQNIIDIAFAAVETEGPSMMENFATTGLSRL